MAQLMQVDLYLEKHDMIDAIFFGIPDKASGLEYGWSDDAAKKNGNGMKLPSFWDDIPSLCAPTKRLFSAGAIAASFRW